MSVSLEVYFNYLVRQGFIREYIRADGVRSLELNIPAIWQAIMMQGEEKDLSRRIKDKTHKEMPNTLPPTVSSRIQKLGKLLAIGGSTVLDVIFCALTPLT